MARKKKRKSVASRRKKQSKIAIGKSRRGARRRKLGKRKPRSFKSKVKGAYRVVVDTIQGTDRLRNKMEQPATSETE